MFNKKHNELLEKINKVDERLSRLIRHLELVERTVRSTPESKVFITQKEYYEEQMAHRTNYTNYLKTIGDWKT